jgi:arsenate reductase
MSEHSSPLHPTVFINDPPRRVLFLCMHNSARSQIAEGLARARAPKDVTVWSAGTEPAGVNRWAIEVMDEIGIDIRAQTSKHLHEVPWRDADTVVTLCGEADEVCPAVAGDVRRLHWPLPDPSQTQEAERLRAFREARDEIRRRIEGLWPAP